MANVGLVTAKVICFIITLAEQFSIQTNLNSYTTSIWDKVADTIFKFIPVLLMETRGKIMGKSKQLS
ncbi:hypothetical protein K2173_008209 [Erythroxylum novogranatense]|uniref:Uncharacterized protein n=1 Tax=Erythroxylum novogranatense TaxID=1862640 RepID=A0AAV8U8R1_9ROSI|nr:hypothetical protein K2173_008209 [Erythroxylum novogranatense]